MRRANATGTLSFKGHVTRVLTEALVSARDGNLHLKEAVSAASTRPNRPRT
jgi:hypothetical protein